MSFCSSVLIIQRSLIWYSVFNLLSLCSYYLKNMFFCPYYLKKMLKQNTFLQKHL